METPEIPPTGPKPPAPDMAAVRLKFAAKYLRLLVPFVAASDIRYYLTGIRVERDPKGGVFLVATDGHTMAVIHDANGSIEGEPVNTGVVLKVDKAMVAASRLTTPGYKTTGTEPQVVVKSNRAYVTADWDSELSEFELYVKAGKALLDEPSRLDWKRILPKSFAELKPGMNSSVNSQYLARLALLCGKAKLGRRWFTDMVAVRFWQRDENSAVIVQHCAVPEMISLIMPMRDSHTKTSDLFKFFPEKAPA